MKQSTFLLIMLCGIVFFLVVLTSVSYRGRHKENPALPYETERDICDSIVALPEINVLHKTTPECLEKYILVAERIKMSPTNLVISGLRHLEDSVNPDNYEDKMMILLRISFECSAIAEPRTGHWLFDKSQDIEHEVNYPIGQRFGKIYLKDTILGYTGPPYDCVKEYQWMLANCHWRDL